MTTTRDGRSAPTRVTIGLGEEGDEPPATQAGCLAGRRALDARPRLGGRPPRLGRGDLAERLAGAHAASSGVTIVWRRVT
jgi:hypothetical protein